MKKLALAIFFFLFLIPIAKAQLITIGVSPSKVSLDFFKAKSYVVEFGFSNDFGEVNAVYTIEPDEDCKTIIKDYPREVLVPKGTSRITNPVKVSMTFIPDYKGDKVCFINVYARPEGASEEGGALRIRPSVGIKVDVKQPKSESYYSISPSSEVITLPNTAGQEAQVQMDHSTKPSSSQPSSSSSEQQTEPQVKETEEKAGFNPIFRFPTILVIIAGVGLASTLLIWKFRDYLPYLLPVLAFFLLVGKAYAVSVNVSVTVAPVPPVRFSVAFPIASLLLGIFFSVLIIKFGEKYFMKELSNFGPKSFISPFVISIVFYLLVLTIGIIASFL